MGTWNGKKKTEYHRERRARVKKFLASFKKECKDCGEDDPVVLDFHHREPKEKKFQLTSSLCYSRSEAVLRAEVAKCDVLCANCHRREEHRLRLGSGEAVTH